MRELEDITTLIAQAQKDLLGLKQKQIAGSSSITVHEYQSANTWDINETITLPVVSGPVSTYTKDILCYFIADTQQAPFVEFRLEVSLNNAPYNTLADSYLSANEFPVDQQDLTALNQSPEEAERTSLHRVVFGTNFAPFTGNLKVKVRAFATDSGTVGAILV